MNTTQSVSLLPFLLNDDRDIPDGSFFNGRQSPITYSDRRMLK